MGPQGENIVPMCGRKKQLCDAQHDTSNFELDQDAGDLARHNLLAEKLDRVLSLLECVAVIACSADQLITDSSLL